MYITIEYLIYESKTKFELDIIFKFFDVTLNMWTLPQPSQIIKI